MTTGRKRRSRAAQLAPIAPADGGDVLDAYIAEATRIPLRTAVEQKQLARVMRDERRPRAERERAREDLILANLRFAFAIAKQYQNRGLDLEDLVSEANAGLCRATDKYDPDVGVNFISYAVWWIRQAVFSAVMKHGRSVRVPLNRVGDANRVAKAQVMLREKLGREPSVEEIAHVTELAPEMAKTLIGVLQAERSLDEPLAGRRGEPGAETLANVISAEVADVDSDELSELERESRRDALFRALEELPPRDRKILILYYGLDNRDPMTLDEISKLFGVTRERVRQLRDRALATVRRSGAAEILLEEWAA